MMVEYTLLTTLAFHHLVIGGALVVILMLLDKFVLSNAELKSWLWMTAFVISTIVPFSLISFDDDKSVTNITTADTSVSVVNGELLIPNTNVGMGLSEQYWHLPTNLVFSFSYLLSLVLLVWVAGSLWRIYNTFRTVFRTRQLIGEKLEKLTSLSSFIGINVFASATVSSPLVIGLINPKVILPRSIVDQLPEQQLKAILLHEHAHILRKDNWFALFQELLAILFWWSPVIRVLNKQIHVEREIACDLRAVAKLNSSKQYAQSLLDCAKLMVNEQRNVLAMGLFSKKKELNQRVGAILTYKSFKRPSAITIGLVCLTVSVFTIHAAQSFSPKISIENTISDARHYSLLPQQEGTQLINAVMRNDLDAIVALQNDGVDINTPALGDGTALMIAVKKNNQFMVDALLTLGADVNQSSEGDGNPLIVAAMRNNLELAKVLLNYGANVNAIVPRDETPLINASSRGYLTMVQLLIERGADVNLSVTTGIYDGYEVRSPLNRAATQEIKDLLLSKGAVK